MNPKETSRCSKASHHSPVAGCSRRQFLRNAALLAAAAPALRVMGLPLPAPAGRFDTRVAIARCAGYGEEVPRAMKQCFDSLGGLGALVKGKTVTVKVNLTGTDFRPLLEHSVGETYMTHYSTAYALARALVQAGARRIRFVESTNSRSGLQSSLDFADWDVKALEAVGKIEFENTRNLGSNGSYGTLAVPGGGNVFSKFDFNRAYTETDVMISLCKLKQHLTAGVTLSMKNLFGITPNALYGEEAGDENAVKGRGSLHNPNEFKHLKLPGAKDAPTPSQAETRIPRIVADICAARPIDLAIIDGITSISGGEGYWNTSEKLEFVKPGILIAGLNPVCADAVGTAVMGYANPRAPRGEGAFAFCDSTLLLGEQAGLGTADLAQIDVRGLSIEQARFPYRELNAARHAIEMLKQSPAAQKN